MQKAAPIATILLENTAGAGSWIGYRFEQIGRIIGSVPRGSRVGMCLDTAHMFEAGYDIRKKEGLESAIRQLDRIVGIDMVKVVHFNDSLSSMGSRVDRHQHLGKGEIGLGALGRVINHPKLQKAAFIMETPKDSEKDDKRNVAIAKKLYKKRSGN